MRGGVLAARQFLVVRPFASARSGFGHGNAGAGQLRGRVRLPMPIEMVRMMGANVANGRN